MKKELISIILNRYDQTQQQNHMSMACLAAIRKFTDQPYEIIVVDNEPIHRIRDEYNVLQLEKETVIELTPKKTVYESYNLGAKTAKGEYFVFVQSDVYVHERTINKLIAYIDGSGMDTYDVAFPQQVPISREQVLELYNTPDGCPTNFGGRDAGMIAITRDAFERCGGWDGRYRNLLGEAAFFRRFDDAGLSWTDRTNAIITHIMAGNNLLKDPKLYSEEMAYDAKLLNGDV